MKASVLAEIGSKLRESSGIHILQFKWNQIGDGVERNRRRSGKLSRRSNNVGNLSGCSGAATIRQRQQRTCLRTAAVAGQQRTCLRTAAVAGRGCEAYLFMAGDRTSGELSEQQQLGDDNSQQRRRRTGLLERTEAAERRAGREQRRRRGDGFQATMAVGRWRTAAVRWQRQTEIAAASRYGSRVRWIW